ncbi:MAG: alpha/beta hydrolase [Chloroflexi bacterium]|nr:alpha/beta hydrolase [Chloroflexota bacterium]
MPKARVNGISLYYQIHGEGPWLVFAHGAGGNHLSWWQQVPDFARRYKCLVYDQRGFGLSLDGHSPLGPKAFIDDLGALIEHLGIDEVRLVAQSMGGLTALGYTLRYPERVRALVMADSIVGMRREVWLAADEETRQRAEEIWRRRKMGPRRALGQRFIRERPEMAFLYRQVAALNPKRADDFVRQYPRLDTGADGLARLNVPVLFIVGEEDDLMPPFLVEVATRLIPHSRMVVVAGAGHSVYFEQPETFNRLALEFLESVA